MIKKKHSCLYKKHLAKLVDSAVHSAGETGVLPTSDYDISVVAWAREILDTDISLDNLELKYIDDEVFCLFPYVKLYTELFKNGIDLEDLYTKYEIEDFCKFEYGEWKNTGFLDFCEKKILNFLDDVMGYGEDLVNNTDHLTRYDIEEIKYYFDYRIKQIPNSKVNCIYFKDELTTNKEYIYVILSLTTHKKYVIIDHGNDFFSLVFEK